MARHTPQHWQELVQQQKLSSLSAAAFCREHNLSTKSFYHHRAKAAQTKPTAFSEVIVKQNISTSSPIKSQTITLATSVGDLVFPAKIYPQIIIDVIKGLQS
ncbi:hypothetical protein JQC92_20650 [Shewanella sp. 202IG2-18]|uniref:IS66 family insertion sequence element accessory protein TnpA n=1 Tax=Parashewanella hymeniacidonis TaxID=2807618 RepID=UPI001961E7F7|nr:hypothetical protein [Parashewanella hymeniacidonis]MBM7074402.1 hypothetical protein [Parashewanella hymeniacidonis]